MRLPLVQLPSSSRGLDLAFVGLVDGGNLSKVSSIVMVHPQNLPAVSVLSENSLAALVHSHILPAPLVLSKISPGALVPPLPSDDVTAKGGGQRKGKMRLLYVSWVGVVLVRLEKSFLSLCVSIPLLHWEILVTQLCIMCQGNLSCCGDLL